MYKFQKCNPSDKKFYFSKKGQILFILFIYFEDVSLYVWEEAKNSKVVSRDKDIIVSNTRKWRVTSQQLVFVVQCDNQAAFF